MNCCFAMIKMRMSAPAIRASPSGVVARLTWNLVARCALMPALDNGLSGDTDCPASGGDGANAGFEGERIERLVDDCFHQA